VSSIPISFSQRARHSVEAPISYLMEQGISNPDIISLAAGLVDQESLPRKEIAEAISHLWKDPRRAKDALQYGTTPGHHALRGKIADRLRDMDRHALKGTMNADDRHPATAGRIVLGTGSQQLLYILAEVLLDPGDIVLGSAPGYFVYMGALASFGARIIPIDTDAGGMNLDHLESTLVDLERSNLLARVKFIYDVTYFNNPTGLSLAADRRRPLVELAERWSKTHRLLVLEDAAYRELRYHGNDEPSLLAYDPDGERVIYAGTFSKPLTPGIRTGYIIAPDDLLEQVIRQKGHHDFGSASLNQQLVLEMLESGAYDRHLATLRKVYSAKLAGMLDQLDQELGNERDRVRWTMPEGGLYVWMELPASLSTSMDSSFFQHALSSGVLYVPGNFCYPDTDAGAPRHCLRLSFGHQSIDRCREGVTRLAGVIRQHLPSS
jgi:2-aminoadipate transaminase